MHFSIESNPEDSKADVGNSVSKLMDIFTNTPPQEIQRAVRISDGNVTLAAQQILTYSEGEFNQNQVNLQNLVLHILP